MRPAERRREREAAGIGRLPCRAIGAWNVDASLRLIAVRRYGAGLGHDPDGKLFIGDLRSEDELIPTRADAFEAAFPFSTVEYECTRTRRCNSFVVSNAGVRRLRLQRISLIPTAVVIKLPDGAARAP